MKRQNIIIILWLLWIASIIAVFFGVYEFIDQKKISLRSELRDNIQALFQGQSNGDAFVGNDDGFFIQNTAIILYVTSRKFQNRHDLNLIIRQSLQLTLKYLSK